MQLTAVEAFVSPPKDMAGHHIQQLYVQAVRLTPTHHQKERKHEREGDIDRHFDVWRGHDDMRLTTSVQTFNCYGYLGGFAFPDGVKFPRTWVAPTLESY